MLWKHLQPKLFGCILVSRDITHAWCGSELARWPPWLKELPLKTCPISETLDKMWKQLVPLFGWVYFKIGSVTVQQKTNFHHLKGKEKPVASYSSWILCETQRAKIFNQDPEVGIWIFPLQLDDFPLQLDDFPLQLDAFHVLVDDHWIIQLPKPASRISPRPRETPYKRGLLGFLY